MNIVKIILSVIFFFISSVFLLVGIIGFANIDNFGAGFAITFMIIGLLLLWVGIILIKSIKKSEPSQSSIDIEKIKEEAKKEAKEELLNELEKSIPKKYPISTQIF